MHPFVNIALRAAREASDIIVQASARPDRMTITEKGKNDYVTDVDRTVEQTLVRHLRKAWPAHSFLCEESGFTRGEDGDTVWMIDPIDGTRNFILGFPHYCIAMACVQKNRVQHAVIVDPVRREEFCASKGVGAQLNGTRIRVGNRTSLDRATLSLSSAGLKNYERLLEIQQNLKGRIAGLRFTGSAALDLAYVACGRLDGGWISGTQKWDVAAGLLLVQEAGGLISDTGGNPDCLDSDSLVFSNAKCFRQLLKSLG